MKPFREYCNAHLEGWLQQQLDVCVFKKRHNMRSTLNMFIAVSASSRGLCVVRDCKLYSHAFNFYVRHYAAATLRVAWCLRPASSFEDFACYRNDSCQSAWLVVYKRREVS